MYLTKDIIDIDVNSADHATLVNAVKAAGLVHWLKGPGGFTVKHVNHPVRLENGSLAQ
jgi:uncharacterized surface protein with fasciclin (FAS1) repeats